jgi:hypothetical protein
MTTSRDSVVKLYAPDHPDLPIKVAVQIADLMEKMAQSLAEGYCQDWGDYKHRSGQILGLRTALDICQKTDKELRSGG